jgi:integrase
VKTTDVKIWVIRQKTGRKRPCWEIRWVTAKEAHSTTRRTKALAETFWSDLKQAAKNGEEFDIETGLPDSMAKPEPEPEPEKLRTFLMLAQEFVTRQWPHAAPKTRDGLTDALATVMPALTREVPGTPKPGTLRTALRSYILLPQEKRPEPTAQVTQVLRWLESASLPIADLGEARVVLSALDALALKLDGKTAGATTINRKRAVFHSVLEYAVQIGDLDSNPLHKVKWTPPKTSETVDPRVVVNPDQAASLLVAVTYVGRRGRGKRLMAFFACMYYAAMRPAEVIGLRSQDCWLPPAGWGKITLAKSRPEVNRKWTDSGDAHEERGLKHRATDDVRPVPIPPILVKILRAHIEEHGVGRDGRIFRSERGKPVASTAYTEVWQDARLLAFTPEQAASPLAGRPYDLRHAAVSLWLNGGVSPTEIANRAGHSVEVLLRVYAKCVSGQEEIANRRIEEILSPDHCDATDDLAGLRHVTTPEDQAPRR